MITLFLTAVMCFPLECIEYDVKQWPELQTYEAIEEAYTECMEDKEYMKSLHGIESTCDLVLTY